jgi:hypothetical protein
VDGSPVGGLPVELEGIEDDVVLTRVERFRVDAVEPGSAIDSCLRRWKEDAPATTPVVRRVGAHTQTVTFRDVSGRWLVGCDDSSGPREEGRRWCGGAVGRLYGGRLRDPRIDILCTTESGDRVGFAWVQPSTGTRYVAVEQPKFAEVYEVAGALPVRIATTSGVTIERSRARFVVSEHGLDGRLVREYELEAGVAG